MTTRIGQHHVVKREIVLSEEEIDAHRDAAITLLRRKDEAEAERKAANEQARNRINGMKASLNVLLTAIDTGTEEREMTVVWRKMTDGEGAELTEVSTGRVVDRRPLEPHERQVDIEDRIRELAKEGRRAEGEGADNGEGDPGGSVESLEADGAASSHDGGGSGGHTPPENDPRPAEGSTEGLTNDAPAPKEDAP